jgi:hypothetical protein
VFRFEDGAEYDPTSPNTRHAFKPLSANRAPELLNQVNGGSYNRAPPRRVDPVQCEPVSSLQVGRRLEDLAYTTIRRLLDCVEQTLARERRIETGAGRPAVANAISHALEELRDIKGRSRRYSGRNLTIAFGVSELGQWFTAL